MKSLTRDVLFPATGAIGLIVSMAIDPAAAQEASAMNDAPAVIAAAAVPVGAAVAVSEVTAAPATDRDGADATRRSKTRIERRCDRIERIGKFNITRCD